MVKKTINMISNPIKSFDEKYGWNEILSMFLLIPVGLLEPFECKEAKWITIKAVKMKGSRKCKEKNRFNVAFPTENPPHNQLTIVLPKYGIADTKFVMTVAPQKDICPQGSTYPRNAVPIKANKISTPETHTGVDLKVLNSIPRAMWM